LSFRLKEEEKQRKEGSTKRGNKRRRILQKNTREEGIQEEDIAGVTQNLTFNIALATPRGGKEKKQGTRNLERRGERRRNDLGQLKLVL